jgi:hypothetical protein
VREPQQESVAAPLEKEWGGFIFICVGSVFRLVQLDEQAPEDFLPAQSGGQALQAPAPEVPRSLVRESKQSQTAAG